MAATRSVGASAVVPIAATGLTKTYRDRPAVDGIDLTVLAGEIYGFLGPNGAGKTTTMRMLLGLVKPDAGSVRLFGRDVWTAPLAARAGVAGIIEEPRLYTYLSGRTNLRLLAGYDRAGVGEEEIEEVLETVELRDRGADRVSEYSQGVLQRLGIAACLVRRPRLLLLDEPGGTVIYAMALQGVAVIHAISGVDPYLLTNQQTAWHALFETPFQIGPILRAIWVSVVFALPPLIAALVIFNRRDIAD
jgi:ABC-type lipopolysaccharide export system ATPase subunit